MREWSSARADRALTIYLNDHLAGATAGARLARRIAAHAPAGRAERCDGLAREIREDRGALLVLMRSLRVPVHHHLLLAGAAAETLGVLKPNGALVRRARLSELVELETMYLGVCGKAALWRTLSELPGLAGQGVVDVASLLSRARAQAGMLEELRAEAGARALAVV
ncbi:hypothetical protein HCJ92_08045 [Streptomyces sp. ventii]|uniref:Uncharacterized protein n=1 Tax=Streptomyces spiramenti TaxID=2720606 RepID=A0ABX1ANM1_9ACTN|nr:hypothetical protein [Streptomyces spiramenti]NJP66243.1 hypothetical protein [Streptomyces spiramenti]